MDLRVKEAQRLYWEIEQLRQHGAKRAALPKLHQIARLHEERAIELLCARDPDGWIDLYSAISAWGEAGAHSDAVGLIHRGFKFAALFPSGQKNIEQQLQELRSWLTSIKVLPSLRDFGSSVF
jgi:hypothetical protein